MDRKRERTANFTELEVRILVDLVLRHFNLIENKKSDAVSWCEKTTEWEVIATEFQNLTGSLNRSAKMLRLKYDCLKRSIKKKESNNRLQIFKTGGGSTEVQPLTEYEKKLALHMPIAINGLESIDDFDTVLEMEVNELPSGQEAATLFTFASTSVETVGDNIASPIHSIESVQGTDCAVDIVPIDTPADKNITPSTSKWNKWKPNQLRKQKHRVLCSAPTKEQLNNKLDSLAEARKEVIQLQLETIRKEEERQEIVHKETLENIMLKRQFLITEEERKREEFDLKKQLLLLLEIECKKH